MKFAENRFRYTLSSHICNLTFKWFVNVVGIGSDYDTATPNLDEIDSYITKAPIIIFPPILYVNFLKVIIWTHISLISGKKRPHAAQKNDLSHKFPIKSMILRSFYSGLQYYIVCPDQLLYLSPVFKNIVQPDSGIAAITNDDIFTKPSWPNSLVL